MADATTAGRRPEEGRPDLRDWLFGVPASRRSEENDLDDATRADLPADARLLPLDVEPRQGDHGDQGGDPTAGGVVDAVFADARVWARRGVRLRRPGRRITPRGALALLGVTGLLVASPAAGYWLASTTTSGSVGASSLAAPSSLAATPTATSLSIAVSAPNGGPTPTGYTVTLTGGSAQPCTMSQTPSPAATCTLTGLASGTSYTLAVRPTLGAWVGPSTSLTTSTASAPAPALPALLAASDSGAFTNDGVTNVTRPTFTGAAAGGLGGATITLYAGSTAVGSTTAAADGSYSVAPTAALADGAYSMTTKAALNGGQPGTASPATSLKVDTVAPAAPTASTVTCGATNGTAVTLSGVSYCSSSTFGSTTGVQWTFAATDPAPSGGVYGYRYFPSSDPAGPSDPTTPTGSTGTLVTAGSATAPGIMTSASVYKVNVVAVDLAGNVSKNAVLTTVVDLNGPTTPSLTWGTGTGSLCSSALSTQTTVYCRGTDPVLTPSASESPTNPVSGFDTIYWTTDGTTPAIAGSPGVASGAALPSGTFSAEGSRTLRLLAADKAGNTSSLSTTVVTDRSGPTVSALTLTNGGGNNTAGTVEQGDSLSIGYADALSGLSPKSVCSDWTGAGPGYSVSGTVTVNDVGTSDTLTFAPASGSCGGSLNIGTVSLNANYVSGASSFAATFTWTGAPGATSGTLGIAIGKRSTPANVILTGAAAAVPGIAPSSSATDQLGNGMSTGVTNGTSGRF